MVSDLLVIVPSRGRPDNIARVIEAWHATDAFEIAQLAVAYDADDPHRERYAEVLTAAGPGVASWEARAWRPLVPKLNGVAVDVLALTRTMFALGFAGDDHLPRTPGWAGRYLEALREMGTGIVYGNDLLQGERLCTSWAMTSDIVRALGRMVPAPVEHMACDNSVMEIGRQAGCLRYLPDVIIEHMHPLAGKADWDIGYARVNRAEQYRKDLATFADWQQSGMAEDVAKIRELRRVRRGVD